MPQSNFHVVLVPIVGPPLIRSADTSAELANILKEYVGTSTYAFPIKGTILGITKGPGRRALVLPDGSRLGIFDEDNDELDPTFCLLSED